MQISALKQIDKQCADALITASVGPQAYGHHAVCSHSEACKLLCYRIRTPLQWSWGEITLM
jgi:hypothetical protein